MTINTRKECDSCNGSGLEGGDNIFNDACAFCDGSGKIIIRKSWVEQIKSIFSDHPKQPEL